MSETGDQRKSLWQLVLVFALILAGHVCIRTLRFTHGGLNLFFVCLFLLTPLLAVPPARRLRRWPKVLAWILLAPVLALSLLSLLFTVSCDVPALREHRELSRELRSLRQGRYSVHLVWEETAGGAVGPHGVSLQQHMFIAPGLYLVKHLDYFEGAHEGSLSAEGPDKVRLHIPASVSQPQVDRDYLLKRWVYF